MKTIIRSYSGQRGFTLVEMMVAAVIGLLLLAGIIQIFISNKTTSKLQSAVANVQENGRFALDFLTKDIRMAGYMGCANSNTVKFTNDLNPNKLSAAVASTAGNYNGTNAFIGYAYSSPLPAALLSAGFDANSPPDTMTIMPGTDIIEIESAQSCPGAQVVCDNASTTNNKTCPDGSTLGSAQYKLADNSSCNLQQNDIVLISDCTNADIHGITNVIGGGGTTVNVAHGANLNSKPQLSVSYGNGASVYKMATTFYYIGYSSTSSGINSNEPALYRLVLQNSNTMTPQELVDGVYDMQILYGEDTDNDQIPNHYVSAANVGNWDDVITARVTLSVRSDQDNVITTPTQYTYAGNTGHKDRRLLRTFTTTIMLRNRI